MGAVGVEPAALPESGYLGDETQRPFIARALLHAPSPLVLDEFSALDDAAADHMRKFLRTALWHGDKLVRRGRTDAALEHGSVDDALKPVSALPPVHLRITFDKPTLRGDTDYFARSIAHGPSAPAYPGNAHLHDALAIRSVETHGISCELNG
jgi:hypothetical protein